VELIGAQRVNVSLPRYDVIFVGEGLGNGLAAYRLHQYRPDLRILLIASGERLGANRTWFFHQADLTIRERAWITPFITGRWNAYDVIFPTFSRTVYSGTFSIPPDQFHHVMCQELGSHVWLNTKVVQVQADHVILEDGRTLQAKSVLDGRGWIEDSHIPVGYQIYFGLEITLTEPHRIAHPVLLDARRPQKEGLRFFSLFPLSKEKLLIGDTCYRESPHWDEADQKKDVLTFIKDKGWSVSSIHREEREILPVPMGGTISSWNADVVLSGMRAGFFHATTGSSIPQAVFFADGLAQLAQYEAPHVHRWAKTQAKNHWEKEGFNRYLNRMLFRAAQPEERFKVLQKIYRFPKDFLGRFNASRLSSWDQVRVLSGKPPVPFHKALRCLF